MAGDARRPGCPARIPGTGLDGRVGELSPWRTRFTRCPNICPEPALFQGTNWSNPCHRHRSAGRDPAGGSNGHGDMVAPVNSLEDSALLQGRYALQRTGLPCCCPRLLVRSSTIYWDSLRFGAFRAILFKISFSKKRKNKQAVFITEKGLPNNYPACPNGAPLCPPGRHGRGLPSPRR